MLKCLGDAGGPRIDIVPVAEIALEQARRYADEQNVKCIAVSDGVRDLTIG